MIARVKHPLGTMYMPLWRLDNGQWVPIGPLAATVRDAKRICHRRMRAANEHIERRTELIKVNLERLHDEPDSDDRIVIQGTARELDADGELVLPGLPLTLDAACMQVLSSALDIDPAERAGLVIADYLRNDPLTALSAVANVRPDLLGHLAAYMASLHQMEPAS